MQVPDRAVWLRTLLAELNRVLNHLLFLGAPTPVARLFVEREALQAVMEQATGGRVHYQYNRVGGLHEDVPRGWTDGVRRAVDGVRDARSRAARVVRRARRRGRRPGAGGGAVARRLRAARPARPASTSTCAATSPTSPTASSTSRS